MEREILVVSNSRYTFTVAISCFFKSEFIKGMDVTIKVFFATDHDVNQLIYLVSTSTKY